MKQQVSPGIIAGVIVVLVLVLGYFAWKSAAGPGVATQNPYGSSGPQRTPTGAPMGTSGGQAGMPSGPGGGMPGGSGGPGGGMPGGSGGPGGGMPGGSGGQ